MAELVKLGEETNSDGLDKDQLPMEVDGRAVEADDEAAALQPLAPDRRRRLQHTIPLILGETL